VKPKTSKRRSEDINPSKRKTNKPADYDLGISKIHSTADLPVFKKVFWSLFSLISLLILTASLTIGIPGDEPIDAAYGRAALDYYLSMGKDTTYSDLTVYGKKFNLQKYYGAGFEMTAALVSRIFSGVHEYKIRHLMVATCGIAILLLMGMLSIELTGWLAGCITLVLGVASPTLVGHMLFNSKDIPFALGFIMVIYFMIRSAKEYPKVSLPNIAGIIVGIAVATSIRIGGILTVAYVGFFLVVKFLSESTFRKTLLRGSPAESIKILMVPMALTLTGIIAGLLCYPNFFQSPLDHVTRALNLASDFPVRILMLFEGKMLYSTDIPVYYLAKSLLITLPLTILLGILLLPLFTPLLVRLTGLSNFIFLAFTVVLPILYITWNHSPVYNGWRHILFFYPTLVVLVGCLFTALFIPFRKDIPHIAGAVVLITLTAKTLLWQLGNYTYQYAYYNELSGGFESAYQNYDDDYQQLGVSEGVYWLIHNEASLKEPERKKLIISSNNAHALNHYYDTLTLNVRFINSGFKDLRNLDWDYAVMSNLFVAPEVRKVTLPPPDAIHSIDVQDQEIAYVIKRYNRNNYLGLKALQKKDIQTALPLLQQAYQDNPRDFNAWLNLGHAYSMLRNGSEIIRFVTPYLKLYPGDWTAHFLMGAGHFYLNDFSSAERYLNRALQLNPKDRNIHQKLLDLYTTTGDQRKAGIIRQQLDNL
jgi:tetratricopeptide (TPR) repeat protein